MSLGQGDSRFLFMIYWDPWTPWKDFGIARDETLVDHLERSIRV